MQDVKDGDLRTILENMQKMNDYMAEKCGWPRKLDNLTWCKMPVKLT